MISVKLLEKYGAVKTEIRKGEFLFKEGGKANYFYQIISGAIKLNNYNEKGQETIQGLYQAGDSFGEPAILGNFPFSSNAVAEENNTLITLNKSRFLKLLEEHPKASIKLLQVLSKRLQFKSLLLKNIKGAEAEDRILALLLYFKESEGIAGEYCVKITRQTIANLIGLRVETVIRALKQLEKLGKVKIKHRKIYI